MSKAAEARTTGGNYNIDYNLRVELGFPDGNINIDKDDKIELSDESILANLCLGLSTFIIDHYGHYNIPEDLQKVINNLNKWYHY